MTLFDGRRLTNATFRLDVERLRTGYYSDKYFENVVGILESLRQAGYTFEGSGARTLPVDVHRVHTGDMHVEAQIFTRRTNRALIAGIDVGLAMLRHAAGLSGTDGFAETWRSLHVEAVHDGVFVLYDGHPANITPVIRIRGRYQDFALLETPILGVLTRASRIATNVYDVLEAANGKPVLYFPARFDLPDVQSIDGYAYWLAVQRYNHDTGKQVQPSVSTDAQAAWWGGKGGGTVPHALIAAFFGDLVETMIAFASALPADVPRIALVDFGNDSVGAARAVTDAFWERRLAALRVGDDEAVRRWRLDGVRLDTSPNVRDVSLDTDDPTGVSPKLVRLVRAALDHAWEGWRVPVEYEDAAKQFARSVKIVATGGFNRDRIVQFESQGVPVDIYGVGSSLLRNDSTTNTDFTMDVVRVEIEGKWFDMAKIGRRANDNGDLEMIDLEGL
ncbi:MAG: nicotinate phosphoribosyltransferase [Anaerolineae bacterium]|nr:nicotinate phosphoribosyltransferase [Anaerolineae bacterium]NUQ02388.1 nicotinate phosphoribosyltransferase [Anaerolineae bacterium]